MTHSITMLRVETSPRADEILSELAKRLEIAPIWPDNAGWAPLWLHLDGASAHDAVVAALDETAHDWRLQIAVLGPER